MAKSKLRLQARELRQKGIGIKTIALKLNVSSSTVSLWCRSVVLSPELMRQLESNAHNPYFGGRGEYLRKQKKKMVEKLENLRKLGVSEVAILSPRELFIAGVALYWAEGFKKDNLVGFSNSDPSMIRFIVRWFQEVCGIEKTRLRFRLALNESYKDKAEDVERYWQNFLNIDSDQFQKTFFQKVKWQKVYDNPDEYHGVLRVRVSRSVDLLRKIQGQIEGLRMNC